MSFSRSWAWSTFVTTYVVNDSKKCLAALGVAIFNIRSQKLQIKTTWAASCKDMRIAYGKLFDDATECVLAFWSWLLWVVYYVEYNVYR